MILILILVYMVIIIIEVPALVKNNWHRELMIFSLLFILGVYLSLAQYYQWPLPHPLQGIIHNVAQWNI